MAQVEEELTEEERQEAYEESLADSGVREYDENYVGAAPDSKHSAYETDAPVADHDEDPDIEMRQRCKEHEEAMAQPQKEVQSFQDWVGERETGVGGPGSSRVSKSGPSASVASDPGDPDDEPTKTELYARATELEIAGRSTMDYDELRAAVEAAEG
jgi:hypothetical protein